ncbi:MAG: DUF3857 domain-containing protein, partial [Bacteroidota bacterium]
MIPRPRIALSFLSLFSVLVCIGQRKVPFGEILLKERQLTQYKKDTTAHAVVLYERGDNYFKIIDRNIRLVKEYHVKIKILDREGFDEGTVEIPWYHNNSLAEKITQLKAVTHNGTQQYNVLPSEIFDKDVSERWTVKSFTFPKMEVGSILEYAYTLVTPFHFNFNGWDFQTSIPKVHS